LLLVALAACATRSSQTNLVASAPDHLPESTVTRLISVWQEQLCRYIERNGDGDPAVLMELRALRSPDVLRPARITFGVLDVEADPPEGDSWDVQGVLVGEQASGADSRYVFLVGIVARSGYLPLKIQDIRLVGLLSQAGKLSWETSTAEPVAVQRYRDAFQGATASRFPADDDSFSMTVSRDRVSAREIRSGADWSLGVSSGKRDSGNSLVIPVLKAPRPPGEDRC
jgi:hypothetical protein